MIPTQYTPKFYGSILCRRGTQNASRGSILCMVAYCGYTLHFKHTDLDQRSSITLCAVPASLFRHILSG